MKKIIVCAAFNLFLVISFFGQDSSAVKFNLDNPSIWKWEYLKICKSFDSKLDKSKEAEIVAVIPRDNKKFYFVNMAVGYDFILKDNKKRNAFMNRKIELVPFFQYNKNTLSVNEQDKYFAGLTLEWVWFNATYGKRKWTPIFTTNMNFNRDILKSVNSLSVYQYVSFYLNFHKLPVLEYLIPKENEIEISPDFHYRPDYYLGVEYDERISANVEPGKGNVGRGYFRFSLNFKPLYKSVDHKLELEYDFIYRENFLNNTNEAMKVNRLHSVSINYILLEEHPTIKLGVNYEKGSDPVSAFIDKDEWIISFKIGN